MKNLGIWIDKKNAKIVSLESGNERLDTIVSDIEDYHIGGGSGTKLKGGPQDVVQDSKYLEREKHQLAAFFKEVAQFVASADSIVIFGPAQTGEKLYNELTNNHPQFENKVRSFEKADNMTDNQLKEWVREYFKSDN